jgi:hypothetical protein
MYRLKVHRWASLGLSTRFRRVICFPTRLLRLVFGFQGLRVASILGCLPRISHVAVVFGREASEVILGSFEAFQPDLSGRLSRFYELAG